MGFSIYWLYKKDELKQPVTNLFSMSTSTLSGTQLVFTDTTLNSSGVIDYAIKNYRIFVHSSNWPGNSTMSIGSVVIEYTIDEAN